LLPDELKELMTMTITKFTVLGLIASFLYGCATPTPQYTLPPNVSSASLKSAVQGADSRHESIDVFLVDHTAAPPGLRRLFSIHRSKSTPNGYVQVPANVPLRLTYSEAASGGRYCRIDIQVTLEQGRMYSLVGGFTYDRGPIPVLTDTRKCRFGVVDELTNTPVPYQ
jgi:hypothetical protein